MNTVQITARISTKSRDILMREASRLLNNAKSRLPVGEILDALISYTEELNEWDEIADWVQSERKGQRKLRLAKDRDRKRRRD
jgi:hypothetical protein